MNRHFNMKLIQQTALLYLLNFLKDKHYDFIVITPLTHERIFNRKKRNSNEVKSLKDIFGWNLPFSPEDLDQHLFQLLKNAYLIRPQDKQWLSNVRIASMDDKLFIRLIQPLKRMQFSLDQIPIDFIIILNNT